MAWVHALAVSGLLFVAGCAINASVQFKTLATALPTTAVVAVDVVDARNADLLGGDKRRVGSIRNGYGMPFPVMESGPDRVTQLVKEATTDALQQAGVATKANAPRKLVAAVKEFWIDGFAGYKAVCEVEYTLRDAEGKVLWTTSAKGATGGMPMWGTSYAEEYLTKALADCAAHAAEQFKTSAFQKAVL